MSRACKISFKLKQRNAILSSSKFLSIITFQKKKNIPKRTVYFELWRVLSNLIKKVKESTKVENGINGVFKQ